MTVTVQPIPLEEINRIITKVMPVLADEPDLSVRSALLSMLVMATFPHLRGDELIRTVKQASELLMTLGGDSQTTH